MKIIYEINDVFPTGKGSSRRTSHLTNKENFNSDLYIDVFCREKSSSQKLDESQNYITRINPKRIRTNLNFNGTQNQEKYRTLTKLPYPINDYLIYREEFNNFIRQKINKTDIIHCRSSWGAIPITKIEKKPKFIFEANGLSSIELPYIHPEFRSKYNKYLNKIKHEELRCAFHADKVIVVSKVAKEYFVKRGIIPNKIEVVPNGVNFDKFKPLELSFEEKSEFLNSKNNTIDENDLIIGYVGSFQPWQGLKSLVKILPELVNEFENIKLVLIGKHKYNWRKELRKIAKEGDVRKNLIIRKQIPDLTIIPSIINCFDIGIAPFENTPRNTIMGFNPLKIYEYLACGIPVISTDLPAIREIADENILHYTSSPETNKFSHDVIQSIQNIVNQPNSPNRIIEKLKVNKVDWNSRVTRLERIYQELLSGQNE